MLKTVATAQLQISYEESGEATGWPVVLLHGFPYDIHAYDEVVPHLASNGARVIRPYLRGYGLTRFHSTATLRSGQQAALGTDLVELLDALYIESAVLAGYDWGGRAACIVAALHPSRVRGLVSVNGYNIQNIAKAREPANAEAEHRLWYQYYFHGERGRAGLAENRREFCRLLWSMWSPTWRFSEATYRQSAVAFDNPDFVDVVIHSYRHRYGLVEGDPKFDEMERLLAEMQPIRVPAITLEGSDDGVTPVGGASESLRYFIGRHENRILASVGHNVPQEAPLEFSRAVLSVYKRSED
ncbi:alpha/beta fold hydrolase [Paraburkholderia tropica]|uniref:alpha/beta fold hydrolase n=1 Tax=Paraburkholderia tropica TaxID=92647 RepID=UPI002AB16410|nr:alpha/beta hydrolase [Paraburkholderia tropica]